MLRTWKMARALLSRITVKEPGRIRTRMENCTLLIPPVSILAANVSGMQPKKHGTARATDHAILMQAMWSRARRRRGLICLKKRRAYKNNASLPFRQEAHPFIYHGDGCV